MKETRQRIVVIGAGINGLLSAMELTKAGYRVVILDRGDIPCRHSASYGTSRIIHPVDEQLSSKQFYQMADVLTMWERTMERLKSRSFCKTGFVAVNCGKTRPHYNLNSCEILYPDDVASVSPLLENGNFNEAYYFSEYGVVRADIFLVELVNYLKSRGVEFYPGREVSSLDLEYSRVVSTRGESFHGDALVIAAGTGTKAILDSGAGTSLNNYTKTTKTKRCYVLYINQPTRADSVVSEPAWLCTDNSNLWGVPRVRDIPAKLGCGIYTHDCEPDAPSVPGNDTAVGIYKRHVSRFPAIGSTVVDRLAYNHWTYTGRSDFCFTAGRGVVVVSDSGSGFKVAPLTASHVMDSVLALG